MELTGIFFALGAGITWGFLGIFGVYLERLGLNGNEVAFVRLFSAFLTGFIYILCKSKIKKTISKENIKNIALIGIITQGCMNLFFYRSVAIIGSITATLLLCTGPLFTVILSSLLLKENLTLQKKVAISVALLGAISLVTEGDLKNINFDIIGVTMGALSGLFYGLYPILSRKMKEGDNPLTITIYSFLIGSIVLLPTVNLGKIFQIMDNFETLMIMVGFGILPTIVPYVLFLRSLNYIDTGRASILTMIEIPVATIIGVFILKEGFNFYKFLGIALILFGMLITKMKFEKKHYSKI